MTNTRQGNPQRIFHEIQPQEDYGNKQHSRHWDHQRQR